MGYEGSAVQSHCACSAPESVHRGRVGLAGPVVQVAVVQSGAEVGAGYAAANFGFSTPISNSLPETHMQCIITASLRATATCSGAQ
jgi:hypothetical protein